MLEDECHRLCWSGWRRSSICSPDFICHHADVDSKTICTNKRCGRDVGHQSRSAAELAVVCAVFPINARPGAANLSSRRGRLKNQCSASKTWTKHQSWYTWLNKNEQQNPLLRHCCACHDLTQMTSQRDETKMIWSLCSPTKGVGWTHHGRLHQPKTELQVNEETDKNMTQKAT